MEPHFLFLAAIGALLIAVCIRRRKRLPLSVAIAAMLAITNLLPTPSYDQYFVTLIPFLAIATIELIELLGISAQILERRFLAIAALLVIVPAAWSLHHITSSNTTRPQYPTSAPSPERWIGILTRGRWCWPSGRASSTNPTFARYQGSRATSRRPRSPTSTLRYSSRRISHALYQGDRPEQSDPMRSDSSSSGEEGLRRGACRGDDVVLAAGYRSPSECARPASRRRD